MCRFMAYHGPQMPLDELLYRPNHSIINQSTHAKERAEPLNGDGWGVGWYQPDRSDEPALYREVRPAWNDDNMRHTSPLIETPLFFTHVRAAGPGLPVQQLNCHPFTGGTGLHERDAEVGDLEAARRRLLFMHNGVLGAHHRVNRTVRSDLDDDLYFSIDGTTDSEHAFGAVQHHLGAAVQDPSVADLAEGLEATIEYLEGIKRAVGAQTEPSHANFCLTDGESVVASRFAAPEDTSAHSLYVGEAGSFESDGQFTMTPEPTGDAATIIASERLFEDDRVWREVPRNHLVTVAPDGETTVRPLDIRAA